MCVVCVYMVCLGLCFIWGGGVVAGGVVNKDYSCGGGLAGHPVTGQRSKVSGLLLGMLVVVLMAC